MSRGRVLVLYSGRVQGVGFRHTVKQVASGYDVTGTVRNLPDGRVELVAEGEREELDAFRQGIRDAGLAGFIQQEDAQWQSAGSGLRGFEVVR
jgi:acylphosphatase